MATKSNIKVFIVDDHEIFRKGLALQLDELDSVEIIGQASSGEDFLQQIQTAAPDIVLMDIKMQGMNGIEATEKALQIKPDLKIVALSMFGEEEYLQNMLDIGAKGFMLKNIPVKELERALKLIQEGKNFFSDELLIILTKTFMTGTSKTPEKEVVKLTGREHEVLQLICKGLSNQEIAKELFLSPRTVDGHRANIISKLGVKNTVSLVTYAIKNKLIELE